MSGFRRVFVANPGFTVLGNIESINTIDIPPPASPLGAGSGVVNIVGEFEKGILNAPTRVTGGSDLETNFGGFGFEVNGTLSQLPVAVQSAGTDSSNFWNGNGFIHLRNKTFAGLIITRVDNSPGTVTASRLACAIGGIEPYDMAPGDTVGINLDAAATVAATFTAAPASIIGTAGTFPTGFVGGETLELSIDGGGTVVVPFTVADQTVDNVVDRVNSVTASSNPFIAFNTGGELELRSRNQGFGASIEVIGGSAVSTLDLPFPAVAQVDTYTQNATSAGLYTLRTAIVIAGVSTNFDASFTNTGEAVGPNRDALLAAYQALGVPGVTYVTSGAVDIVATGDVNVQFTSSVFAEPTPSDVTIALTTTGVFSLEVGTGNVSNIDLVTLAEASSIIETAVPGAVADSTPTNNLRICNSTTPVTGTIEIDAASTGAAALGLTTGIVAAANSSPLGDTLIPAGTRIQDATTGAIWVTLEDTVSVTALATTLELKVRPGVDDDTAPTAAIGDLNVLLDSLDESYTFTNSAALNRLTDSQMDVRYLDAIDATIDVSGTPFDINIMYSARTTERIMQKLRDNAVSATATGHRARKAVIGPPLATTRAIAQGSTGVGVGNTGREQRAFYAFPGLTTFIPEIAVIGELGGPGFTDTGVINIRSDGFYASVGSVLPPEENRGQQLSDTNYGAMNALSLEDFYNKEVAGGIGLTIDDYILFKAAGIIAPRTDRTSGLIFQSDVTSVNPLTQQALVDAKRRFMGDFIIDSLGDIAANYVKKLNTPSRRRAFISVLNGFLEGLKTPNQPDFSRIADYKVVDETSNEQRAQGFQVMAVSVQIFASMDFIVFRTQVGATVNVEEL